MKMNKSVLLVVSAILVSSAAFADCDENQKVDGKCPQYGPVLQKRPYLTGSHVTSQGEAHDLVGVHLGTAGTDLDPNGISVQSMTADLSAGRSGVKFSGDWNGLLNAADNALNREKTDLAIYGAMAARMRSDIGSTVDHQENTIAHYGIGLGGGVLYKKNDWVTSVNGRATIGVSAMNNQNETYGAGITDVGAIAQVAWANRFVANLDVSRQSEMGSRHTGQEKLRKLYTELASKTGDRAVFLKVNQRRAPAYKNPGESITSNEAMVGYRVSTGGR